MSFMISDRKAVARLKYQMKKFEKGLADDEQLHIGDALQSLRRLLDEHYDPCMCCGDQGFIYVSDNQHPCPECSPEAYVDSGMAVRV